MNFCYQFSGEINFTPWLNADCCSFIVTMCICMGPTTAVKFRGTKVWVPTPGRLRQASPPPAVRVHGYHPRTIFENSDAKPCILVTTWCEISCFLKTTAKKSGGPIHCWSPNIKVGGPVSPGPCGCSAYVYLCFIYSCVCMLNVTCACFYWFVCLSLCLCVSVSVLPVHFILLWVCTWFK